MSLIGKIATTVVGAATSKLFGGGGGPDGPKLDPVTGVDMANKLSAECGFPITQADANYAKAASGGDRRLACEILRPAGAPFPDRAPARPTPPISPTIISGGAAVTPAVLRTPALPPLPTPLPGGGGAFSGGPRMSLVSATGGMGALAPIGGQIVRAGTQLIGNIFRTSTGKITGFMVGGRRISRKAAVKLAREVGIGTAAATLGIGAVELAQAIMDESTTRRRRRGITARDLSNARRVNCKIARYARDLGIKPAPARRRTCR